MKCPDWNRKLPSLLDEERSGPGRRELEAHLGQCEDCRGRWSLLTQLRSEAGKLGGLEPGDGVWQGIQQGLTDPAQAHRTDSNLQPTPRLMLRWATALAAATLAAVWTWQFCRPTARDNIKQPAVATTPEIRQAVAAKVPATSSKPISKARPAAKPGRAPSRRARTENDRQYVIDDVATSDAAAAIEGQTQYIMPALSRQDLERNSANQQFIMPAVYIAGREPF